MLITVKLITALVFTTRIVQFLYFLNPKFSASSHLLGLYRLVCVGPGQNPICWFSHAKAQMISDTSTATLATAYKSTKYSYLNFIATLRNSILQVSLKKFKTDKIMPFILNCYSLFKIMQKDTRFKIHIFSDDDFFFFLFFLFIYLFLKITFTSFFMINSVHMRRANQ